jgi:ABC-type bacteriocin/lantibiotic exporter with double-glycine peptidase domain
VLDTFCVPNAAYQLSFDQLSDVPLPFIAHVNRKGFTLVTQFNEKQVTLSNGRWKNKIITADDFKKSYTGSVLIAEKDENSGEPGYEKKYRKEIVESWRMPVVFTGAGVILIAFLLLHTSYLAAINWQIGLLTIFKTAGLITSVLLLVQSIDTIIL